MTLPFLNENDLLCMDQGTFDLFIIILKMNIIKMSRFLYRPLSTHRQSYYFAKNSNQTNKGQQQKNENYLRSKSTVNKVQQKQNEIKEIKQIGFNNEQDFKFILMGNILLMSGIPFWAPVNIGMCLLNGGLILSRLGQQTKKYLLLINNNQLDSLGSFRPLNKYLVIILTNMVILGVQSLLLATNTMELSLIFNMVWLGSTSFLILVAIRQKILPSYFYLALIPLFISIVINFFSETIRSVLLDDLPTQKSIK